MVPSLIASPQTDTNEDRRLDERRTALVWRPRIPAGLTISPVQASGNLALGFADGRKLT